MGKNSFVKSIFVGAALLALFSSCASSKKVAEENDVVSNLEPVVTYVNTAVNKADGKISTVLLFESISEVTAIHPISRMRYPLEPGDYKYIPETTEVKFVLHKSVPYKASELAFHIVGQAANPGVFVLAGIDSSRGAPGVFFEGKVAVEGSDYTYEKGSSRLTSLVPLNVDKDSFEICWATRNGEVTFSNNTQKYRDAYIKFYNDWSRSVHMRQ